MNTDTAAGYEMALAQAEARIEALMAALTAIKGYVCGEAMPRWENT